jgi:hypothetical protein
MEKTRWIMQELVEDDHYVTEIQAKCFRRELVSEHRIFPTFWSSRWPRYIEKGNIWWSSILVADHSRTFWLIGGSKCIQKVALIAFWSWNRNRCHNVDLEESEHTCNESLDGADRDAWLRILRGGWELREIDAGGVTVIPDRDANVGDHWKTDIGKNISRVDGETSYMYRNRWRIRRLNYLSTSTELHNIQPVSICSWVGGTPSTSTHHRHS